jgi:hypothetical protein
VAFWGGAPWAGAGIDEGVVAEGRGAGVGVGEVPGAAVDWGVGGVVAEVAGACEACTGAGAPAAGALGACVGVVAGGAGEVDVEGAAVGAGCCEGGWECALLFRMDAYEKGVDGLGKGPDDTCTLVDEGCLGWSGPRGGGPPGLFCGCCWVLEFG